MTWHAEVAQVRLLTLSTFLRYVSYGVGKPGSLCDGGVTSGLKKDRAGDVF